MCRGHKKLHTCVGMWRNMQFFKRFSSFSRRSNGNACLLGRLCFKSVYSAECDVIDFCKNSFAETFRGSLLMNTSLKIHLAQSSALDASTNCGKFPRNSFLQSFNEIPRSDVRKSSEKFLIKTSQWSEVMWHPGYTHTSTILVALKSNMSEIWSRNLRKYFGNEKSTYEEGNYGVKVTTSMCVDFKKEI